MTSTIPAQFHGPAQLRVSPAAHREADLAAADTPQISVREVPFRTMVSLRVTEGTEAYARAEAVLEVALPAGVGQSAELPGGGAVLWLSPDEFLVVAPADHDVSELLAVADDLPGQVVDVSANRTTFELRGPAAKEILETAAILDLHPEVFTVGRAVITLYGQVPVIIHRVADETYHVLPRASFADYLVDWFLDAMGEYQPIR